MEYARWEIAASHCPEIERFVSDNKVRTGVEENLITAKEKKEWETRETGKACMQVCNWVRAGLGLLVMDKERQRDKESVVGRDEEKLQSMPR